MVTTVTFNEINFTSILIQLILDILIKNNNLSLLKYQL